MATSQVGWSDQNLFSAPNTPFFRTTDGGKDWKQVVLPQELVGKDFWVFVFDADMAFLQPIQPAGAGTALLYFYRTVDGGATWQRCNWPTTPVTAKNGMGTSSWTFLDHMHGWVMTPLPDPSMIKGGNDRTPFPANDETLFRTDNGGQTWQLVAHLPLKYAGSLLTFTDAHTGWLVTSIDGPGHIAPSDPRAFPEVLYVTHDGGSTWKQSPALPFPSQETLQPYRLLNLSFFNQREGYFVAAFTADTTDTYYIYMTQDGGNTWQVRGNRLPTATQEVEMVDATHFEDRAFLYTLTNGQWMKSSNPVPGGSAFNLKVKFVSSQIGLALLASDSNKADIYRTDDGGKHWEKLGALQ
ncbi:hypothetical protein EPA93_04060 [Ktedonosporobacter rubrisoli]|uniref:Photosynthesis system II assembly factor Ycf48/Hcf136-like domain-containing protein n=1 Tax=Ktedonosporobacter rubrisoli TaxID=2509675 RepID=A0A4V0YY72_KTERU|nr:hypothetical protein [Ktedonosporobacter rubrisoli]QBD75211.1 hypothetical protein EPA93_04060 [Ktedonosporobacter rubrisoli]